MELRHLRYFVMVAEERNITRAAARLRVAQPALSRQLSDLEEEVGVKLLDRGRHGVNVTTAGREFHRRVKAVLADAARAADAARIAGGAIAGRLTLGFPTGLHLDHLSPVIRAFRAKHPRAEFAFIHQLPAAQLKSLREGSLDVAFVTLPGPLAGMEHAVVWRVPFAVIMPETHRLARRKSLEFKDLAGEDFVFCTRESRPEFYDEFFRHCTNAGFRPQVVQEVGGYPTTMLALIGLGVGLSVLPHFERAEGIRGIVWRPLARPKLWVDFALVWPRKTASPLLREFVTLAQQMLGVAAAAG
ncbi:MAG: LysR family transcriptional regulator, partial [Verrucomicrobia bacterium]|nr:LysR family transcriptional regulator [Verrucomicrobiota bacterium]